MKRGDLYPPWLCGFLMGSGAGETNHHWYDGSGLFHSGWVGLALGAGGFLIYVAMWRKSGKR